MVDPCKALAAAIGNAGIRIICNNAVNAGTLGKQRIHTPDLAAAASEGDAVFRNITDQLRACLLQNCHDFVGDLTGRTAQDFVNLGSYKRNDLGHAGLGISALDVHAALITAGVDLSQLNLDGLRGHFADHQTVLTADIAGNGLVKGIAGHLQRGRNRNAVHTQHSDIGSTAADVHHHMTLCALDIQTRTQSGCQRFFDQVHTAGAGFDGSIDNTALFHFGDTAGNADDHTGLGRKHGSGGCGLEHSRKHPHRHFMVGNDAVTQRFHSHNIAGGTSQHIAGRRTYLQDLTGILVHRNHRGLTDNQTLAVGIDQNIGVTQVDAQVIGK